MDLNDKSNSLIASIVHRIKDTLRTQTDCWLTHPCFQLRNSLGELCIRKAIIQICSCSVFCLKKIGRYSLPAVWLVSVSSAEAVQLPQSPISARAPRRVADPIAAPGGKYWLKFPWGDKTEELWVWSRGWAFLKQSYFCNTTGNVNELAPKHQ